MIFCSQRTLVEQSREKNKGNAGGYTSSSSANSEETVRLYDGSSQNESSNSNFWSLVDDKHKENDYDKEFEIKRNIKQNNTATKKLEVKLKKKIPFTYQMKKKFKEDSIQPPNLRGDIEHINTIKKANKIDKISYIFDIQDKPVCNEIENHDTNGRAF